MSPVPPRRTPLYAGIDVGATKIEVVITGADFTPSWARRASPRRCAAAPPRWSRPSRPPSRRPSPPRLSSGSPRWASACPARSTPPPGRWRTARTSAAGRRATRCAPSWRSRLGAPVAVENDVRTALLGEHRIGAAAPYRDVLAVWFGTGVGGALLLDGVDPPRTPRRLRRDRPRCRLAGRTPLHVRPARLPRGIRRPGLDGAPRQGAGRQGRQVDPVHAHEEGGTDPAHLGRDRPRPRPGRPPRQRAHQRRRASGRAR